LFSLSPQGQTSLIYPPSLHRQSFVYTVSAGTFTYLHRLRRDVYLFAQSPQGHLSIYTVSAGTFIYLDRLRRDIYLISTIPAGSTNFHCFRRDSQLFCTVSVQTKYISVSAGTICILNTCMTIYYYCFFENPHVLMNNLNEKPSNRKSFISPY
jgi:hypothetical protein